MNKEKINDRVGEINYNTYNEKMIIIKYNNANDIDIKFDNGYKVNSQYGNFKRGTIKSPYAKTVCGVGYLGEGKYIPCENSIKTKSYVCWENMLKRSFSDKVKNKFETYKDVTCCEEWLNYQNFAKWYEDNYYEVDNEVMNLDKDILIKGNKIYSPETCIFVPQDINTLFTKCNSVRGKYPIGVSYDKTWNRFRARTSIIVNGKVVTKNIGNFDTSNDAYYKGYKPVKEKYIKEMADKYKNKIPLKLYNAMYNWEVSIND